MGIRTVIREDTCFPVQLSSTRLIKKLITFNNIGKINIATTFDCQMCCI